MISFLKGKIIGIEERSIIINVNNLGWNVHTIYIERYHLNEDVELFTHMHVREDELSLWGFKSLDELNIFKLLLTVSGVGPKIGLLLLEEKGIQEILYSIEENKYSNLKVSGVGEKTAQKIVIELKNKIAKYSSLKNKDGSKSFNKGNKNVQDAIEGLKTLGYREVDILDAVKDESFTDESSQEIIRRLLTKL